MIPIVETIFLGHVRDVLNIHSPRLNEDFILSPWIRWKSRLLVKFSRNRSSSSFPSLLLLRLFPCMDWTVAKVGSFASQANAVEQTREAASHSHPSTAAQGFQQLHLPTLGPHASWSLSWSAPALCPCVSSP